MPQIKHIITVVTLFFLCAPTILANGYFDINSLPASIAPLNWNMSSADIKEFEKGSNIQLNNYNAIYFDEFLKVDALVISNIRLPLFSSAVVHIEKVKDRIIGIRVDTDEADSRCWNDEQRPAHCRRDDVKGLTRLFADIGNALEKQYGPGERSKPNKKGEQTITWQSAQGQLMLFIQEAEFDGWYVGLWLVRR